MSRRTVNFINRIGRSRVIKSSSSSLPLCSSGGFSQSRHFSSQPLSRLSSLREQLASEDANIDEFIENGNVDGNKGPEGRMEAPTTRKKRNPKKERKPSWLSIPRPPSSPEYDTIKSNVRSLGLATVCEEARCPNIGECWGGREGTATATIMIMGDTCTRACRFCAVKTSNAPPPLDPEEPKKVAEAVGGWGLGYVVLTSVDRDDLPDQGAGHFAEVVKELKRNSPDLLVEALTPDFSGDQSLVSIVANSGLDVYAHNMETVRSRTKRVRDRRAGYDQSLSVLQHVKQSAPHVLTKTSIMLGCGETKDEIQETMEDLRAVGCDVLTLGQYLQPTPKHMKVASYVTPEDFEEWGKKGEEMGFKYVASGPLVRSSYKAGEFFIENMLRGEKKVVVEETKGIRGGK